MGVGMGPNPRIPAGFPREWGWKICETRGNSGNGYNAHRNTAGVGKTDTISRGRGIKSWIILHWRKKQH